MKLLWSRRTAAITTMVMGFLAIATGCEMLTRRQFMPTDISLPSKETLFGEEAPQTFRIEWSPKICFAPDPLHGGELVSGLTGKLFFFDKTGNTMDAPNGSMTIHLYDATPRPGGKVSAERDRWELDPASIKQLAMTQFGLRGYNLYLPWEIKRNELGRSVVLDSNNKPIEVVTSSGYSEDVKEINMLAEYKMPGHPTISAPVSTVKLDHTAVEQNKRHALGISDTPSYEAPLPNDSVPITRNSVTVADQKGVSPFPPFPATYALPGPPKAGVENSLPH